MTSRGWKTWVVAALALLVVGAVAGPYVYIHFIEKKAPKELSVSTATLPPDSSGQASAAPVALAGEWKVRSSGTLVGYRVKEVLFGQSATAYGRTSSVTGGLTVEGTKVTRASFTADLTTVHSDQSRRDAQFQGRIMDTARFPTATFTLSSPLSFGSVPAPGATVTASATGKLTLKGTAKTVTFQVQGKRQGALLEVSGRIPVAFADYGIANPSFGGINTDDHGVLEFLLVLAKA